MKTIGNIYIRWPILFDCLFSVIIWLIGSKGHLFSLIIDDMSVQTGVLSSIIGTDVSLAGFILAALTIIVTFKSNVKAKGMEEATNAMELILSSVHYESIKLVFKEAILEFVLLFIILYFIWMFSQNFAPWEINLINICATSVTAAIILRTLVVLFGIIGLDVPASAQDGH
jgi:hypothetical protein